MKTLNLNINLDVLKLSEEDRNKSAVELSIAVIKNVILTYGITQRGLTEEERRKYYKICDALETAKENIVELEDDWFAFIKKCFKDSKLMPDNLLRQVENEIDKVKSN